MADMSAVECWKRFVRYFRHWERIISLRSSFIVKNKGDITKCSIVFLMHFRRNIPVLLRAWYLTFFLAHILLLVSSKRVPVKSYKVRVSRPSLH